MLQLGVIGCGRVTSMFHLRAIKQLQEVAVIAVSDIDETRMLDVQAECGAPRAYQDCDELFQDPEIEAVAINTPPRFHEELTLKALEHEKHVLCEKPLAETKEGCLKIKEAQNDTSLVVLSAHNYTFSPSLELMEEYIGKDTLGSITGIKLSFENNLRLYRSETDFRRNNENGIVEDVLPHILSVVHQIAGHITDIETVEGWCKDYDVCDNLIAKMRVGEVPVDAYMSWTKLRPRFSVSVDFENGRLYTDLMINPYKLELSIKGTQETIKEKGMSWYLDLIKFKHPSFTNQYNHFLNLIQGTGKPKITIDDEINILDTLVKVSEKMEI